MTQHPAAGRDDTSGRALPLAAPRPVEAVDLDALGQELLGAAIEHASGLRTRPVVRGPLLQSVLFALRSGSALPEHDAPPAATLQVLRGRVVLVAGPESWELHAGQVLPIPAVRHHVDALVDSVCLLTIARP